VCARFSVCMREREREGGGRVSADWVTVIRFPEMKTVHPIIHSTYVCHRTLSLTRELTSKNIHLVPSKVVTKCATFFFIPRSRTFNYIPILYTLNKFRGCLQSFQVNTKIFNTVESSLRDLFVSAFVYKVVGFEKMCA
jgi:hypothetical protein